MSVSIKASEAMTKLRMSCVKRQGDDCFLNEINHLHESCGYSFMVFWPRYKIVTSTILHFIKVAGYTFIMVCSGGNLVR
jgi:hypothetical protein